MIRQGHIRAWGMVAAVWHRLRVCVCYVVSIFGVDTGTYESFA